MQDPTYVEAMVAKAEGRAPIVTPAAPEVITPAASTETPTKFAGKYDSVEAMEKGYLELQKAYSAKTTATPVAAVVPPVAPVLDAEGNEVAPVVQTAEELAAAAALESKGLDLSVFNTEFAEKGELSPASYEALAKAGIPQAMVDSYIAGQQLIGEQLVSQVYSAAGGEAGYQELMTWASTNLNTTEKAAYQAVLDTNDIAQVLLAVKGLQADFTEVNGKAPVLLSGDPNNSTGDVYESSAQMKSDMKDPRYQKDPAFRAMVAAKLGRSDIM